MKRQCWCSQRHQEHIGGIQAIVVQA